jgi:hypothetical protein
MKRIIALLALSLCLLSHAASLTPSEVHAKVVAVAPITGISFGTLSDKSTWTVQYQSAATDAEKIAGQGVLDAITTLPLVREHRSITALEFRNRMTAAERAALKSSTDATVVDWVDQMLYAGRVEIDTEESEAMQAHLVSLGLFTSARIAEIFK